MTANLEEPVLPVLRFADFTDEWQHGRVDSFLVLQRGFDLTKKSSGEGRYPVYSSSGISYYHNEFKVRGPGLVTGRKGSVGPVFFVDEDFWPHDTSLWVKDFKGNDVAYCYYFLTHFDLSRFDEASSVPTLNRNNVHRERAAFPTLPEQRKIADFLTAVDGRIGQLSQKKALLEDYKKGVMQQLFNQAVRFKDDQGNDFPAWEEKTLGEVLTIGSGRDYKHLGKGNIPVYGSGGVMTFVDASLYEGESVCIGRKGTIDKPRFVEGAFWTVDTLFYTHSFKRVLPRFIYVVFQQINWKTYNEASGVPSLSKSTIESIPVSFPSLPEQTKIANFLTALDRKIESVAQQITHTQTFKKGLLQQMFV
jgi:type I restriction enzyme S subunit